MTEKLDKKFVAMVAAFLIAFPIFHHAVSYQAVDAIAQGQDAIEIAKLTSFKIFAFGMACIAGVAILSRWHYAYWPDASVLPPRKKRYWPNGEENTVKPDERLTLSDWQALTAGLQKRIDRQQAELDEMRSGEVK